MSITRDEKASETRKNILQAAIDEFYLRGVGATTFYHIAQTANVTRGAIYWHFKNKQVIFDEIQKLVIEEMGGIEMRIIQKMTEVSPMILVEMLHQYIDLSQDRKFMRLAKIVFIESMVSKDVMNKQKEIFSIITNEWIRGLIDICISRGYLPSNINTDMLIQLYTILVTGIFVQSVINLSDDDFEVGSLLDNNGDDMESFIKEIILL